MIDRRGLMAGMAAGATGALLPARVLAAGTDRLFAATPLADNRVARSFARVDLRLPDIRVLDAAGPARLRRAIGAGPRLLTLWSEWCVPCLIEARDLAGLRPRVAGGGFDIVSLLTGSVARLDHAGAAARLAKAGAGGLTLLVEPDGAHAVADALAADGAMPPGGTGKPGGYSLPCTLLVDRHGRVRGRALGIATIAAGPRPATAGTPTPGVPHRLTEAEKQALMGPATRTAWASPDSEAFLLALRGGLLDRV